MSLNALSLARRIARAVDARSHRRDAVRTEKDIVTVRSPIRAQLGSGSAVKSFREAADRIVRQESSSPTDVLRLLGSAVSPARTITGEPDEWDVRLGTRTIQHDVPGQARPAAGQLLVRPGEADHRPGQLHLGHRPLGGA